MKKETDIDDLARMVAEGFSAVNAQFTELSEQMDEFKTETNERFDRIEKVVYETNRSIDTFILPTLDDHARRIKDLELAAV